MPQKPPAPSPPPPKVYDVDGIVDLVQTSLAMHRWGYPYHHDCGHYRGFLSEVPTDCANCIAQDQRDARRRIAGAGLACLIAFVVTLLGCCAAGGAS